MTDWNDGYVSDIAYVGGFYREQMPAHLDTACLVAGFEPPAGPDVPFTYCELGCGLGDTAMIVAAGNPHGQIWGFDFNPAHIAHARAVAARSGLDNVHFAERSFEDLATAPSADLPAFDYVTLHGVWTWVSRASQAHIVAFLRRHLRPGGLVCISYNAMPGWTGSIALQRLLYETGRGAAGGSDLRIREAIALARQVSDVGGSAIDAAALKGVEAALAKGHLSYLAHEYMNEHWRPVFFSDVAAALAPAKLDYVCSANLFENFPQFCMTAPQRALVDRLPPGQRQTAQDFFCPRIFRRDIFMRGPRAVPVLTRKARLGAQRLALNVPGRLASLKLEIPLGEAMLAEAFYNPALAVLANGIASVSALCAAAPPDTVPAVEEILGMLAGGKQVLPAPGAATPEAVARVRRYNRTRNAIFAEEAQHDGWLVGAATASAIRIGLIEMLVYEAVASREERGDAVAVDAVIADVHALLALRSMSLKAGESDAEQGLADEIRAIIEEWLPIWRRLGTL